MCKRGFDDALSFLRRNNLISCTQCLTVQRTISLPPESPSPVDDTFDPECLECKRCITVNVMFLLLLVFLQLSLKIYKYSLCHFFETETYLWKFLGLIKWLVLGKYIYESKASSTREYFRGEYVGENKARGEPKLRTKNKKRSKYGPELQFELN